MLSTAEGFLNLLPLSNGGFPLSGVCFKHCNRFSMFINHLLGLLKLFVEEYIKRREKYCFEGIFLKNTNKTPKNLLFIKEYS